jgi:hypothetical protein
MARVERDRSGSSRSYAGDREHPSHLGGECQEKTISDLVGSCGFARLEHFVGTKLDEGDLQNSEPGETPEKC